MVSLNEMLVCPVCHEGLPLNEHKDEQQIECLQCQRSYSLTSGVYNMTPLPLPDEDLRSKWDTWQKLQDNGLLSYTAAPEFNLSIGDRKDAQAFKAFARASGLILDIGCGPQNRPSYLPENCEVVGMDPLLGQQPRGFSFLQGIGEYLPFRDETFDHILYASSLDHIINPKRSLAEASRCLVPGGHINLWIDGLSSDDDSSPQPSGWKRYPLLARKGLKSLLRHNWLKQIGLSRTLSYIDVVSKMKVPEGANDYFHFTHLNAAVVLGWLAALNLTITHQQDYPEADSVFVQATKPFGKNVEN
jgi:SAM-dependent methyltransferase